MIKPMLPLARQESELLGPRGTPNRARAAHRAHAERGPPLLFSSSGRVGACRSGVGAPRAGGVARRPGHRDDGDAQTRTPDHSLPRERKRNRDGGERWRVAAARRTADGRKGTARRSSRWAPRCGSRPFGYGTRAIGDRDRYGDTAFSGCCILPLNLELSLPHTVGNVLRLEYLLSLLLLLSQWLLPPPAQRRARRAPPPPAEWPR
eukprot:COSAG06_NODE_5847_length_3247_cov_8.564485_3_plen_206_part_00